MPADSTSGSPTSATTRSARLRARSTASSSGCSVAPRRRRTSSPTRVTSWRPRSPVSAGIRASCASGAPRTPTVREEAIEAIDRESQRMARLTADLLNILHADQGVVLKSEQFDLNIVVRKRLARIASRWIEKDLEFVGPEDESLPMVGDPGRVEDVISILLDNAAKYTPAEGSVFALTERTSDTVTVQVSDTGQGIPAGGPAAHLRPLLPHGGIARRGRERLRSRPGHRQEHRRQHGRRDRGEQHHRAGHHVHRHHSARQSVIAGRGHATALKSLPYEADTIPRRFRQDPGEGACLLVHARSRLQTFSSQGWKAAAYGALPGDGRDGQRNGLRRR